jgi:hypothetical protein
VVWSGMGWSNRSIWWVKMMYLTFRRPWMFCAVFFHGEIEDQYSAFTHLSYRSNCNIYLVLEQLFIVCHLWSWRQFVLVHYYSTEHPYTILLNLSRCSQPRTHRLRFIALFHHTWTLQATSKHRLNSLQASMHVIFLEWSSAFMSRLASSNC